jgi:hypothetical protein
MSNRSDESYAADAGALTAQIRALNDAFRRDPLLFGVQIGLDNVHVTRGVAARGADFVDRAGRAVRDFADFDARNYPYGEHDFGVFTLDDDTLFWKIDLYERELVKRR